jgi:integrase
MSAAKVTLVHYKYKTYSNGKHPIMVRITANRKSRYIATGYSALPENWDDENNKLIETRSKKFPDKKPMTNAKAINSDMEMKFNEVLRVKQQVSLTDGSQSSQLIKDKSVLKYEESQNFIEYGKKYAQFMLDRKSVRTSKNFTSVLKRLGEFRNGRILLFSDVDVNFLTEYQTYLLKDRLTQEGKTIKGVKTNTANYHLKTIRSILYKAMNESEPLISRDKNPFNKLKIKNTVTQKETLSIKEIEQIRRAKLKAPQQQKQIDARNYYLFSFNNAGIRISDLIQLKFKNIIEDRLHYEMGKTGHFKSIKLNDESKAIIKVYRKRNSKPDEYIFPILKNDEDYADAEYMRKQLESKSACINGDLKKLAKSAKINKRLHFHSSRHSFSNIARKKKADLYSISKALGHKSLKVTEMYLASFDEESLDETMLMVLGK